LIRRALGVSMVFDGVEDGSGLREVVALCGHRWMSTSSWVRWKVAGFV
jgi:hypothetical protein